VTRILYIHPGPVPPDEDERKTLFYHISDRYEGDVIQTVWGRRGDEEHRTTAGRFRYHFTFSRRLRRLLRIPWELTFYVITGLWLFYVRKRYFEVVVSYAWETTGMAAVALKWLTGARFILFAPNSPGATYLARTPKPGLALRARCRVSLWLLKRVLKQADGVWLCYPQQLAGYRPKRAIPTGVFPDFLPRGRLTPSGEDHRYILLVGQPWYLKGVDLLIRAYKQVADEFPEYRLRVVGGCRDRGYFEELRAGDKRIEFIPGVPNEAALRLIDRCSVFVLPSRTEGMARVLLEAMGLCKPIIASRVGGIPYHMRDGEDCLLVDPENVEQLVAALQRVLGDRGLARRLAQRAYESANERFSERQFAASFDALVKAVLDGAPRKGVCAEPSACQYSRPSHSRP